jgi:multiple sugar transport system substrate-binding protein
MKLRLAALAALLVLTACGSGDDAGSDGPADLRMTIWSANEKHLALFDQIAADYKKDHPEVGRITFESVPFDSYTSTLTTQIGGGNPPDLAWVFEKDAPDFVASGALEPIEVEGELVPSAIKLWETDGKLAAYPFSTSPFGVFVNNDLLTKAGQKTAAELVAAGSWNWETVVRAAAAVQAKTGKGGLVVGDFDYKGWDNLSTIWRGWGADAWTGDQCGFDKPEMAEAMTFLHKAIFTDKAMPGPGTTADFFAGDAGMVITQISRAALLEKAKFGWDLVPLPAGPKGAYSVIGQGAVGVLKKGEHVDVAKDFLGFFTNEANSAKLAQFFPPPRKSQLTTPTLAKANPLLKPAQLESVVIKGIETGVVKPNHAGNAEISQAVRSGLDPLWRPDADVQAVLTGVCAKIGPLLAKAK